MKDPKCEKCRCRLCIENTENDEDGMCPNCEYCSKNNFEYLVKKPQDCEMWEDEE